MNEPRIIIPKPTLATFMDAFAALKEITEPEFRGAGLYRTSPSSANAEKARATEWHAYRSNPHLWLTKADKHRQERLWALIVEKIWK